MIPDYSKLSGDEKLCLVNLFEAVKESNFPSILNQLENKDQNLRKIDREFIKLLGIEIDDNLLDDIYRLTANEIEILRRLMAEGAYVEEESEEEEVDED